MAQLGCFCLCETDFVDCSCPEYSNCLKCKENCVPPKKKKHLSLERSKGKECRTLVDDKENDARFQFLSEDKLVELKEGFKPANTEKSTKWAFNNLTSWKIARERAGKATCPDDLLQSTDPELLCNWLSQFVAEPRTTQGKPYPPSTLYQLLAGLLRHMRDQNSEAPDFLDKGDLRFKPLHKSLDSLFCDLRTKNIGTSVRHAEPFTKAEEQMLWEKGILDTSTLKSLLNAVFYMNGKNVCLRGDEEHRRLSISQVVREYNPDRYIYVYRSRMKDKKGTFTERHFPTKLFQFMHPREQERDVTCIY